MQTKFCSKCGNTIKEGERFCARCGAPVKKAGNSTPNITSNNTISPIDNPEGTVILGGMGQISLDKKPIKRGNLTLSFEEMLRGCTKVIDFGTGKRFEIVIPTGLSPGDVIKVEGTGIIDPDSGNECEIELTTSIV